MYESESKPPVVYVSPYVRETEEKDVKEIILTPWTVQNICYEVIKNYITENPPQKEGYRFTQTYDPDDLKTGIALEIAYHYKDVVVQKRPAIFVSRGEINFKFPTINQVTALNPRDSEKTRFAMLDMPIILTVVATNVGFTEQLAEYIFKIFLRYQEVIKDDFCLRQFKLVGMTPPSLYLESKDHFAVQIQLLATFDMGTTIKRDDLRLKTVAYTVYTNFSEQPLEQQ
jgi:hypothetical protein